ncbi:MAG: hypothetical protein PF569_03625 [Candidatus Woesearchaeota archaeon]|nr:hypothetical protein [Candidatus Woesearchaeota archaeon]
MALTEVTLTILIVFLLIVISSLPLYLAAKTFGGKTTILKTFFVMILVSILTIFAQAIFRIYGTIIAFILVLIVFKELFHLSLGKAFLVWIFWLIFVILFTFIFSILGLSFFAITLF